MKPAPQKGKLCLAQAAYAALGYILTPVLHLLLSCRLARGKEDATRIHERKGKPDLPRPAGTLAWIHAASVGEALSMLILAQTLVARGWQVLLTTGTVTSAQMVAARAQSGVIHQYIPLDHPAWVKRFVRHWKPDLVIWSESELWPNLLREAAYTAPLVMVNARMSAKSLAQWQRYAPGLGRALARSFSLVLAQTQSDADAFTALGAPNVIATGSIKQAAQPLPHDTDQLEALQKAIGTRPVLLFASTHKGEDEIAFETHHKLLPAHLNLLTVIVPRHPARGADIAALCGPSAKLRSKGETPDPACGIYIADTLGELGLFFRLAGISVIGNSFGTKPGGGHNPIEPAMLGSAIIFGPDMSSFADSAADLLHHGAALQALDAASLATLADGLLNDPVARRAQADAALTRCQQGTAVLAQITAALEGYL